jgi:hypothetical protein
MQRRVSASTGKQTAAIPVGLQPYDATFAFGSAWTTTFSGNELERIDPAKNKVSRRWTLRAAVGVVGAFGSIWASGADGVLRIDPKTNKVLAKIPIVGATWTAASATAVWIDTSNGLARINPKSNSVVATVRINGGPLGDPSVVAGNVCVPLITRNRIDVIDPETNTAIGSVQAGAGPFVVTEIAGEAWIPSWKGADIWRIQP